MDEAETRTAPARPLLEAGLVFAALYLSAYLPADPRAIADSLGKPGFHVSILAALVPKALLVLYLIARSDGFAAFGITRPRLADLAHALLCALGAVAVLVLPSALLLSFGLRNPLMEATRAPGGPSLLLVPLVLASSLAVGYGEEIFFRSYLIRRLRQAGLSAPWAALASSLVFGSAHGVQGPVGLALASLLGLWFAWRWLDGGRIHEIAVGHAMYDAGVILFALFR
ncbi:MAG TPA: CPBP family intramembrane glutamic endopeptidase [Rectinemataceae bacterium]|nr:CPBP family intramembrane glutamic endopeptidase [Rectinemataceae bacterium]